MENTDIKELFLMLKDAHKTENWDLIEEAIYYIKEYLDEDSDCDE